MQFTTNCQSLFGEFGSQFEYKFDIVYNLENIMNVGLKDSNVTVIPGDLTAESVFNLKKYHIDNRKWKEDITEHLKKDEQHHAIIKQFFSRLPEDFKDSYKNKFGDETQQIIKMKRLS